MSTGPSRATTRLYDAHDRVGIRDVEHPSRGIATGRDRSRSTTTATPSVSAVGGRQRGFPLSAKVCDRATHDHFARAP